MPVSLWDTRHWWGCTSSPGVSSGPLPTGETLKDWSMSREENRAGEEAGAPGAAERAGGGFRLEKRGLRGILSLSTAPQQEAAAR